VVRSYFLIFLLLAISGRFFLIIPLDVDEVSDGLALMALYYLLI
jgi:hypothetical protein